MLRHGAPLVLPPDGDDGGKVDRGQQERGVRAVDQGADLFFENLRGGPAHHVAQGTHEGWVGAPVRMQHGRQPGLDQGVHALFPGKIHQHLTLFRLAGAGRDNARVEQAEPLQPLGRQPQDLHGDAPAHGEAADREARGRLVEHALGHGGHGIEAEEVEHADVEFAFKGALLMLERIGVAKEAGEEIESRARGHGLLWVGAARRR